MFLITLFRVPLPGWVGTQAHLSLFPQGQRACLPGNRHSLKDGERTVNSSCVSCGAHHFLPSFSDGWAWGFEGLC